MPHAKSYSLYGGPLCGDILLLEEHNLSKLEINITVRCDFAAMARNDEAFQQVATYVRHGLNTFTFTNARRVTN